MRNITTIVIHHSVTPQSWSKEKTLKVIDDEHHNPNIHSFKNGIGLYVAYHMLIFPDGNIKDTRPINEVGHHAGNLPVNNVSVGICLIGNFETDQPTPEQSDSLKRILKSLMADYGITRDNIKLHKEVRLKPTACPGKNITHAYIDSLLVHRPSLHQRLLRRARLLRLRLKRHS